MADLQAMYQEIILDHYRNPQGRGLRDPFDAEVHHVNPTCGDEITLRVTLAGGRDVIEDISYDGQGCSISQASASVLHDQVSGRSVADALRIEGEFAELMRHRGDTSTIDEDAIGDGIAFAGVAQYPARIKCALLSWMALKDALAQAGAVTHAQEETSEHDRT